MILAYHVILEDHLIKRVVGLYGLEPMKVRCHPIKFDGHRHCGTEDIVILVYHEILEDYVIKGSCDFMVWNTLR